MTSYYDSHLDQHFDGIPYRYRITLRHYKNFEQNLMCSAIEDLRAISISPNNWLYDNEIEECKIFSGSEHDARQLRSRLEVCISNRYYQWSMYQ